MSTVSKSDPMTSMPAHGMSIQEYEKFAADTAAIQVGLKPPPSAPLVTPVPGPIAAVPVSVPPAPQSTNSLFGHPATPQAPNTSYRELLLKDPELMAQKIKEDARSEWAAMEAKKNQAKKIWDEFYQENPDLKDVDWHVQSTLGDKYQELANLPLGEAKTKLAAEARRRIDALKARSGMKIETLSDKNATTLPASSENAPVSHTPEAKTNFVSEWQAQRRRHRKV